jgi:cob(I)alamin adenosyltransferase
MWYFTGKGDSGETSLFDGSRVKKNDPILDLLGSIDELNSFIGLVRSKIDEDNLHSDLYFLQTSLSKLMGMIAGASSQSLFDFNTTNLLDWLEAKILLYSKEIFNPKEFTFPGDNEIGAIFDICRTVSRRTERIAVDVSNQKENFDDQILMVLNRLSSYFYILRLLYE